MKKPYSVHVWFCLS